MITLLSKLLYAPDVRRLRGLVVLLAVLTVLQGVIYVLLVPLLRSVFDARWGSAWAAAGAIAALGLAYLLLMARSVAVGNDLSCRTLATLLRRLGSQVATFPLGWFDAERTGELTRLAGTGTVQIASAPANLLRPIIVAAGVPVTIVVALCVIQWQLAVALVVGGAAVVAGTRLFTGIVKRYEVDYEAGLADSSARIVEYAVTQPALRIFGRAGSGRRLVDDALDRFERAGRRLTLVAGFVGMSFSALIIQIFLTAVIALSTYLYVGGTVDAGMLIALLVLSVRFVEPLLQLGELTGNLRVGRSHLERAMTILDAPVLPEPATPAPVTGLDIELRDVTFGYDGDQVLTGVSFTAPAQSLTALVGPSGSGKSTILRLIARFYDVDDGAVLLGGNDVRDIGTAGLLDHISIVFQDVYLFDGTIADNIRQAKPDATPAELAHVAAAARVDEIIARLPDGWDTRVGEGGTALSGGEKQRVSIARALLKDAPVVLLDEVTSAMDPHNERALQDAIAELDRARTVLMIAHRLPTVRDADAIVVLDDGAVVQTGTHEQLIGVDGVYRDFFEQRRRAQGWAITP